MSTDLIDRQIDEALGTTEPEEEGQFTKFLRQQQEILDFQMDALNRQAAIHNAQVDKMMAVVLKISEEQTRLTVQRLDGLIRLFERMGITPQVIPKLIASDVQSLIAGDSEPQVDTGPILEDESPFPI